MQTTHNAEWPLALKLLLVFDALVLGAFSVCNHAAFVPIRIIGLFVSQTYKNPAHPQVFPSLLEQCIGYIGDIVGVFIGVYVLIQAVCLLLRRWHRGRHLSQTITAEAIFALGTALASYGVVGPSVIAIPMQTFWIVPTVPNILYTAVGWLALIWIHARWVTPQIQQHLHNKVEL